MHAEHKMWVPELVFGHLLTSSNYDDDEKKTTGGRNGYGAKLTNIFSTGMCSQQALLPDASLHQYPTLLVSRITLPSQPASSGC